ncbi:WW domain binding protein 4 [Clonorchis sinensis]|uniref:WW domain binding protein 4 n=1 Tax=Clonorchis sinensis TaxID=79923 RepID=A0A3R7EVC2_CLOSI|nr:WW domain binding protein 4 [Clonorchis sinensis]
MPVAQTKEIDTFNCVLIINCFRPIRTFSIITFASYNLAATNWKSIVDQLDHVDISHRWRATIQDCRSFCGTQLDSDRAVVFVLLTVRFPSGPRESARSMPFHHLRKTTIDQEHRSELTQQLSAVNQYDTGNSEEPKERPRALVDIESSGDGKGFCYGEQPCPMPTDVIDWPCDCFDMADYWKSNPKKFCDVCKCWMADNKISVQNHETGLRHKANVEKKMNELLRNNKNSEREEQKLRDSIQQMNDNAFVGMMKDLARDPSLAKRYGITLTDQAQQDVRDKVSEITSKDKTKKPVSKPAPKAPKTVTPEWREATTPDGRKYYWNTVTRVTQWERPEGDVAPEVLSVKAEKERLQHFVLNKLVELSESGSKDATAAVHQAFNAPFPETESTELDKLEPMNPPTVKPEPLPAKSGKISFSGPKIDLLGPWVPVEDEVPAKLPKLDLPTEHYRSSQMAPTSHGHTDTAFSLLTHLEETTEADIQNARHLETTEKEIVPGSVSDTASKVQSNVPRLVFRRGPSSAASRSFRGPSTDD